MFNVGRQLADRKTDNATSVSFFAVVELKKNCELSPTLRILSRREQKVVLNI